MRTEIGILARHGTVLRSRWRRDRDKMIDSIDYYLCIYILLHQPFSPLQPSPLQPSPLSCRMHHAEQISGNGNTAGPGRDEDERTAQNVFSISISISIDATVCKRSQVKARQGKGMYGWYGWMVRTGYVYVVRMRMRMRVRERGFCHGFKIKIETR